MDTNERIELVVRTAAKLSKEDRERAAELILETGEGPGPKAAARWLTIRLAAELAVGCRVDGTRRASSVTVRRFAAWRMRQEGFIPTDIARAMGVNHATVYHYIRQMETCFELPVYYHRDIEMYTKFIAELEEHDEQVREQGGRDA